jgi:uncharacterized Zn-finger protein
MSRARPFRRPSELVMVAFLFLVQCAVFVGLCVSAYYFFRDTEGPDANFWGKILLATLPVYVVVWILRMLHANRVLCPLCHGTIFWTKPCQKHPKAAKWPLVGYKLPALLNMMLRGVFRCMYCGTSFRNRR